MKKLTPNVSKTKSISRCMKKLKSLSNSSKAISRCSKKLKTLLSSEDNRSAYDKKSDSICLPQQKDKLLPFELIIEILSWLPCDSLMRCQLVCKQWQALIYERWFMEMCMDRRRFCYYFQEALIASYKLQIVPRSEEFYCIAGCDGLLLVYSMNSCAYYLWNPATSLFLSLPVPEAAFPHAKPLGFAFSYVKPTKSYRIVSIYFDKKLDTQCCAVFTPGQSEKWRNLLAFQHFIKGDGEKDKVEKVDVLSTGSIVHCIFSIKVEEDVFEDRVISLDLETECFTVTCLPEGVLNDRGRVRVINWEGKLAFAEIVSESLQLLELVDHKQGRWCEKKTIIRLTPIIKENKCDEWSLFPLFAKQGDVWFWLKGKKVFAYTIGTGNCIDISKCEDLESEYHKFFPHTPSLVSLEGMLPDTVLERERIRLGGSWSWPLDYTQLV